MADTITARDANQRFSRLLAEVEAGREVVITRHGKPVARLVPEGRGADAPRDLTPVQARALAETEAFVATLKAGLKAGEMPPDLPPGWPRTRDEIYDDIYRERVGASGR